MKLSETVQYINSALNYPALTYIDVNLFFDMAISELNTTLHTSLPLVSEMIKEFRQKVSNPEDNKVFLSADPSLTSYVIPTDPVSTSGLQCYYLTSTKKFYIFNRYTDDFTEHDVIKGVYITPSALHLYQSVNFQNSATWVEIPTDPEYEAELSDYLPNDWVIMWLIPYVCFKYTARDGGTAQTFAEELTQGFQQLQETYNVPDKVVLATYADKPAYTKIVEKNLPNLNILIPTRAIYENMKHSRNTNAIYGSFYDRGGF